MTAAAVAVHFLCPALSEAEWVALKTIVQVVVLLLVEGEVLMVLMVVELEQRRMDEEVVRMAGWGGV